jgi:hypothetical protein
MPYTAIHSEGALISEEILYQIAREELPGQKATDFGLPKGTRLGDEIARAWSDAQDYWRIFSRHAQDLTAGETGVTLTRERWIARLFNDLLGYELTFQAAGAVLEGQTFPISHRAGPGTDWPPVHIAGFREDLDQRPESGRRRLSPQALVQEYLNRTDDHLWGIVTNGYVLRLLRQTTRTSRPSYLEFDLQSILDGQRYTEFALFFRLCHRTRCPRPTTDPHKCLFEDYFQKSIEQGGRVREHLREGVEQALKILGTGFLRHPKNGELADRLQKRTISVTEFHRQLLRLVYRLLFLMVAEERKMILPEGSEADRQRRIYEQYYSVARLRVLVERVLEESLHGDLWLALKQTFRLFNDVPGSNPLGIPPLNGELFSSRATPFLDTTDLYNRDLIGAVRYLSLFVRDKVRQRINYAALDVEELGSVYESLLDLEPYIDPQPEGLTFDFRAGTQRKSTGSYYTRPELVAELIESALVPVLEERVKEPATREEKEQAILGIKVCDPASGSGHFLLAAARRIGRELAKVRTGEEQPTPREFHLAVRDVIARCLYAVDKNPLAVDLCKVALWLEGHWTGKPLSFLDHRVKCGDSLVGVFDPESLKHGIPDDAFNPVTGDAKKAASAFKKRNKRERESPTRFLPFDRTPVGLLEDLARQYADLGAVAENSPADVKRKADLYARIHESPNAHEAHRAANLWTAAFFAPLQEASDPKVPTTERLWEYMERSGAAHGQMIALADSLAGKHRFFHWFLEFPEVFAEGGFDVVLGNPPWDMLQLDGREFFIRSAPQIAAAPTMAARERLIEGLATENPALHAAYLSEKHAIDAYQKLVHESGRFPFTSYGRINLMALFTELARHLLRPTGRAGLIVPTGIATDAFNQFFFADLVAKRALNRLIGFENEAFIFPAVHHSFKFCALTIAGNLGNVENADFAFFCRHFEDVKDPERHFQMSSEDFGLLNPNTRTCPIFRTRSDADLTKQMYRGARVLVDETTEQNPWGFKGLPMFMMNTDSKLFRTSPGTGLLPLYEGKMIYQFDHRFGTYEGRTSRGFSNLDSATSEQLQDPRWRAAPFYWVPREEVETRLEQEDRDGNVIWRWDRQWLLGFRRISNTTNERTFALSVLPLVGLGDSIFLALPLHKAKTERVACLAANMNALPLDYIARQKMGGTNLNFFIVNQLAMLSPDAYSERAVQWIACRVVELVYTA